MTHAFMVIVNCWSFVWSISWELRNLGSQSNRIFTFIFSELIFIFPVINVIRIASIISVVESRAWCYFHEVLLFFIFIYKCHFLYTGGRQMWSWAWREERNCQICWQSWEYSPWVLDWNSIRRATGETWWHVCSIFFQELFVDLL